MRIFFLLLLLAMGGFFNCLSCFAQQAQLVIDKGHNGSVWAVCVSADGKKVASGSNDGAKVWDAADGVELRTFSGDIVRAVTFSPDGKILATGGDTRTVLWDVSTGKELRVIPESGGANSLLFVAGGKHLLSGGFSGIIEWDVASGRVLRNLGRLSSNCSFAAFSPDGRTAAVWEGQIVGTIGEQSTDQSPEKASDKAPPVTPQEIRRDYTIKVYELAGKRLICTLTGHSGAVTAAVFSTDGKQLASTSSDGTIRVWNINTGKEVKALKGNQAESLTDESIAFSPDAKSLAWGRHDGGITLWDLASGRELFNVNDHLASVDAICFTADGKTIVSGSGDHSVRLWNAQNGQKLRSFSGHCTPLENIAFTHDGQKIFCVSLSLQRDNGYLHAIRQWRMANSNLSELGALRDSPRFSPDSKVLATAIFGEKTIELWDTISGKVLKDMRTSEEPQSFILGNDGKIVAGVVGSMGDSTNPFRTYNKVVYWDVQSGREQELCNFDDKDNQRIFVLALSPDSKVLAVSNKYYKDGAITLWDLASKAKLFTLNDSGSLEFSPDGKILASGGKLWDATTGKLLHTFDPQAGDNAAEPPVLRFSPDGKILAVGKSGELKLITVSSGQVLKAISVEQERLNALAFQPVGKLLASAGDDGTLKLWSTVNWQLIGTIIPLDAHDWAVIDPNGRFDASPDGLKLLHWRQGSAVVGTAQLKEKYHDPGLLPKLLETCTR